MSRKLCYISGTRADFGLMRSTLHAIAAAPELELSLVVTGMHLSPRHGETVRDIEAAGLPVTARVPVPMSPSTGATMARNIGLMLGGFVDALEAIRPDLVLLLGDRGEMLAGALAAIHLNMPVAHIHGGERSGTVDEPVRHAVSKLSHFHFAATQDARTRLIRMGERAENIFVTGAPGLDDLAALSRVPRAELARTQGLDPARPIALMIYHPVLQEGEGAAQEVRAILDALAQAGMQTVALMPNADAGSEAVRSVLEGRRGVAGFALATHFPRDHFVSWMAAADVMIGNSSAGIIEAASFGTPVVNVGSRQRLRERNANVRDSEGAPAALAAAIAAALGQGRHDGANIYGDGRAGARILDLLRSLPIDSSLLAKTNVY
jgi:GDP/UDP-N,N'-diacetylbacillosamine 2-epimerase (hydrolysing)